jgi:hypothetical protein
MTFAPTPTASRETSSASLKAFLGFTRVTVPHPVVRSTNQNQHVYPLVQEGHAFKVHVMQILSDGLITMLNGVYASVSLLLSPVAMFVLVSAGSLAWLCRLEVAELDRRGSKPEVGRH